MRCPIRTYNSHSNDKIRILIDTWLISFYSYWLKYIYVYVIKVIKKTNKNLWYISTKVDLILHDLI